MTLCCAMMTATIIAAEPVNYVQYAYYSDDACQTLVQKGIFGGDGDCAYFPANFTYFSFSCSSGVTVWPTGSNGCADFAFPNGAEQLSSTTPLNQCRSSPGGSGSIMYTCQEGGFVQVLSILNGNCNFLEDALSNHTGSLYYLLDQCNTGFINFQALVNSVFPYLQGSTLSLGQWSNSANCTSVSPPTWTNDTVGLCFPSGPADEGSTKFVVKGSPSMAWAGRKQSSVVVGMMVLLTVWITLL